MSIDSIANPWEGARIAIDPHEEWVRATSMLPFPIAIQASAKAADN
ncbi:hypothetical protein KEJ19_05415 [Candidatus Bathyarchaeota archaeon]|nr:hypothetical protein [Candidatus Bathyarchaeota archaeon]